MRSLAKNLLAFSFGFLLANKVAAIIIHVDSMPANKPWKLSQQQFLDQYGKDDTARAVINYYFEQQYNKGQKKLLVNTFITAAGIAVFAIITTNGSAGAVIVGTPFILAGLIFGIFAFRNAINMVYFSRKRLYRLLKKYFSGEKIPDSLRKDIYRKK